MASAILSVSLYHMYLSSRTVITVALYGAEWWDTMVVVHNFTKFSCCF